MSRGRDLVRYGLSGMRVLVRGAAGLAGARNGKLREQLRPWMRFDKLTSVPFDLIAGQGVRAVLFDLENTLIPPGGPFTAEAREVIARVRHAGLKVAVVSNCAYSWVPQCLGAEEIPFVAPAHKPGTDGFLSACKLLGVKPSQAVYVGDQMITDVFGAQRAGLRAVLVEPQWRTEPVSSKFQRALSRVLLKALS